MLRPKVRFQNFRCIRAIAEAEEEPSLRRSPLMRWIQQVRREFFDGDYRSVCIRDRHVTRPQCTTRGSSPVVRGIRRELHVPLLYVTQDQIELTHIADRVLLIEDGTIVGAGAPAQAFTGA